MNAMNFQKNLVKTITSCVSIRNLTIGYGNCTCLAGVNLEISPGEITAIIGPSGCGKSSLLLALNRTGEMIPGWNVSGEVLVNQENINRPDVDLIQLRTDVGMIFQRPNPFPLSIRKNIQLALGEHRVPKSEWSGIVQSVLEQVGLWNEVKNRLDRSALNLSGGQQQRLCIARALALSPKILLMDEPCSALDPISTAKVEELILSLKGTTTVVIVTHNLAQAKRIADNAVMFWNENEIGRLVESGNAQQLFEHPSHQATKDFVQGRSG